jgi:hypothetical protein
VSDSYLIDYLLTSGAPSQTIDRLSAEEQAILESAQLLTAEFARVRPRYELLDLYYRGVPPLPTAPVRMTTKYAALMSMSRSNWCALVVDVVDERLRVDAVVSAEQPIQDDELWGWWKANNMPQHSSEIHTAALTYGLCYVSVWPSTKEGGAPRILGESPLSTYVALDEATFEPYAAIRIWTRRDGKLYGDYTTTDFQFRLVSEGAVGRSSAEWSGYHTETFNFESLKWTFRNDVIPVTSVVSGRLPYVLVKNKPTLTGEFLSEIEGILPIQDRINKTTFDRLVTQEMTAFPQRWVTGIDIPEDPQTGKPVVPFDAAVDRVWTLTTPDGKFGQFPQSEPNGYLQANTSDIQALATQSRTPPHYLLAGMGQFPSGESVRATEYGLTRKVDNHKLSYGDSWGDVMRLASLVAGDEAKADDASVTVRWQDVEAHSEAEVADAVMKLSTIPGVPLEPLLQRAGLDPSTFDAYRARGGVTNPPPQVEAPTAQ